MEVSGNIIKNVKGVIVPGTNGEKGIEAAAGIVAGGGDLGLEVLSHVSAEQKADFKDIYEESRISGQTGRYYIIQ